MKRYKHNLASLLEPNYVVGSVTDIDVEALKKADVKALVFDIDSTLVEHGQIQIAPETATFLHDTKLDLYLATNRSRRDAGEIAEILNAKYVQYADGRFRKPSPAYFGKLQDIINKKPGQIAMIGDRLYSDVFGANRAGWTTIWVENLGKDPWFTRVFRLRHIERWVFERFVK